MRGVSKPVELPAHDIDVVHVRRAESGDLDAMLALETRSFSSDRLSRAQYRRHLGSDSALVLIASVHHQLQGNAVVFFRRKSRLARLYSLATLPESRGRGVGSALLGAVIGAAQRRGCVALRLEVRKDNAPALHLYERCGFRQIGEYAHYYEDGADARRYERLLD
jgi:ribosomal-protein-alanine N-acetyltransferase